MSEMRLPIEETDIRGAKKHVIVKLLRGTGCRSNINFESFSPEDKEKYLCNARKLLNR